MHLDLCLETFDGYQAKCLHSDCNYSESFQTLDEAEEARKQHRDRGEVHPVLISHHLMEDSIETIEVIAAPGEKVVEA